MKETYIEGMQLQFKSNTVILNKFKRENHFNTLPIKELSRFCEVNNKCVFVDRTGTSNRGNVSFKNDKKNWRYE